MARRPVRVSKGSAEKVAAAIRTLFVQPDAAQQTVTSSAFPRRRE
jgi:hypothetical protein